MSDLDFQSLIRNLPTLPEPTPLEPQEPEQSFHQQRRDDLSDDGNKVESAKKGLSNASTVVSALQATNPPAFAQLLIRQMMSRSIDNIKTNMQAQQADDDPFAELYKYPGTTGYKSASDRSAHYLSIIKDNPPVSVLMECLIRLYGEEMRGFEPDTIVWDLMDDGVQVDNLLMQKINCGLALLNQQTHYNNSLVFENVILTLNDIPVHTVATQKPDVAHLCYGVAEMEFLFEKYHAEDFDDALFDDEIDLYVAVALEHDHYVLAPDNLDFAQELLNRITEMPEDAKRIQKELPEFLGLAVSGDIDPDLEETMMNQQLLKLAGCSLYVKEKMQILEGSWARL